MHACEKILKLVLVLCTLIVMELSSKSKSIKKKYKKKKTPKVLDDSCKPVLKPDSVDGSCNWVKLQKIMGPISEDTLKKSENKAKTNLKDAGQSFCHQVYKRSNQKHQQAKGMKDDDNSENCAFQTTSSSESVSRSDKVEFNSKNDRNHQSHKFNFKERNENSPKKNSDQEIRKNKYLEKRLTKAVAMDCEMVGTGPNGETSIIARVSIVNAFGVCLYDEFVKPKERVTDYRTRISGVRPSDLKNGKDLFEVQKAVLDIIEGRILVGHAIKHDLDVLFISHPRHLIRDTSLYKPFRELCGGRTPSLKKLTSTILGCEIQGGEHSSVEDALATMLLYLRQREEWESEVEDAQAAMLLYLREKHSWERQIKQQRKRKPRIIENQAQN